MPRIRRSVFVLLSLGLVLAISVPAIAVTTSGDVTSTSSGSGSYSGSYSTSSVSVNGSGPCDVQKGQSDNGSWVHMECGDRGTQPEAEFWKKLHDELARLWEALARVFRVFG